MFGARIPAGRLTKEVAAYKALFKDVWMLDIVFGTPDARWARGLYGKRSGNIVSIDAAHSEDEENGHQTVHSTEEYDLRIMIPSYRRWRTQEGRTMMWQMSKKDGPSLTATRP